MPRNGSGTYSLPTGNPVVAGTTIEASWANTTLNDVATEMTGSLARSGSGGMTGPLRLDAGTAGVPALAWSTETTTGLYRAGTNDVRLAVATSDVMRWQAAGVSVTGTLGVSAAATFSTTLAVTGTTTLTGAATLTANPTLSAGTANGVLYLNGSLVATSGSALTFDGTNLATTGTSSATKLIPTGGGATGNGMYLPAANALAWSNNGVETMRLDASGNLGLGVTPSAWSGFKALELNDGYYAASANGPYIGRNSYWNGSNWIYKATSNATQYLQVSGAHLWNIAPSGTAGNAITFTQAMTLEASGNLLVGTTNSYRSGRLVVKDVNRTQTSSLANLHVSTTDSQAADLGGSIGLGGQIGGDETPFGYISGRKENSTSGNYAGYLAFATQNSAAAVAERMRLDSSGNLGLNTTTFGTSAAGVLSLGTGTAPTTGPADTVQLFSVDRSAGNTIPAVRCEGSGVTNAGITNTTVTHKIAMQVNGTIYYLLATTNAT